MIFSLFFQQLENIKQLYLREKMKKHKDFRENDKNKNNLNGRNIFIF